jgi:hypothetical protein
MELNDWNACLTIEQDSETLLSEKQRSYQQVRSFMANLLQEGSRSMRFASFGYYFYYYFN